MLDAATWGPRQCVLPLPLNTLLIQKQKVGDEAIDFFYEQRAMVPGAGFTGRVIERWVCRMKVARSGSLVGGALDPVVKPKETLLEGFLPGTTLLPPEIGAQLPTPDEIFGGPFRMILILAGAAVAVLVALAFAKAS